MVGLKTQFIKYINFTNQKYNKNAVNAKTYTQKIGVLKIYLKALTHNPLILAF